MALYEIFSGEELKIAEKIQQRRYQMLVHSFIYYELNENLVTDSQWSKWAMELVDLQAKYPNIAEKIIYAEDFADWDGSSGAFLDYSNKPNIVTTAKLLLRKNQDKPSIAKPLISPVKKPLISKPSTTKKKLF
jgi:hypothetical protein